MSATPTAAADALEALEAKPIDLWDAWLFAEAEASLALRPGRTLLTPTRRGRMPHTPPHSTTRSRPRGCWRCAWASNRPRRIQASCNVG
jgi:hypothetical protein